MLRLETLGGLTLTGGGNGGPQPRRRLALLARLAPSGDRGVSRDEILACFWPERDADAARHSLDQLLYEMRRALGVSPAVGTSALRLDPRLIESDVSDFSAALRRAEHEVAVNLYRGPFLQGFYVTGSPDFERWVESVRTQLAAEYRRALEGLAKSAAERGQHEKAVSWWRRLATEDPLSSRVTLALMRALADAGDRAEALECAREHERVVRAELGTYPDPSVAAFAEQLRVGNAPWRSAKAKTTTASSAGDSSTVGPEPMREITAHAAPTSRRAYRSAILYLAAALALAVVIFGAVGRAARARTLRVGQSPPARQQSTSIAAYELYVRGIDPTLFRSDSGIRVAIDYLSRAIAFDSAYAPAYAALANRYATAAYGSNLSLTERRGMYTRAAVAAQTAVALDDSLAEAHTQLGLVKMVGSDVPGAIAELDRAIALDPDVDEAREDLAKVYELAERPADALAETQRAVLIHPLSASANAELARALYLTGRYDEALAQLERVAAIRPPLRRTAEYTGEVYASTGRWKEAIAVLRPAAPQLPRARGLLGYALARSGGRAEAEQILHQMVAVAADSGFAFEVAQIYTGLGDFDRAFLWLDRSFDDYSLWAIVMGPLFDDLRADSRFTHVRRRLGHVS